MPNEHDDVLIQPTFLDFLRDELAYMSREALIEPRLPVREGDHVIGEVPPSARLLYSLAQAWTKTAEEIKIQIRFGGEADTASEHETIAKLMQRSSVVMDVFWMTLKDLFNLWSRSAIGLRQNWVVVWREPPPDNPFSRLFGGGPPTLE